MKKDNLTQTILEEISEDTTGMEHTRREAEKLDTQGVDPKEYENAYRTVESKAEELERPLEEKTDTVEALVEAFDQMQDSSEFQEQLSEGLVDAEKVRTMIDIIEEFRGILPRLLLTTRLWENLADEQHKIVDTAQLARDQSSIEKYIEKASESQKEAMQELAQMTKEQVENNREFYEKRVGRASENLEKIIENQNQIGRVLEQQTQALTNLNQSIQNQNNGSQNSFNQQMNQNSGNGFGQNQGSKFNQPEQSKSGGEEEKEESEEDDDSGGSDQDYSHLEDIDDLQGSKRKLVKLYRMHGDEWDDEMYADEIGIKENTVSSYKKSLASEGYINL